jgi:heat shock protein HtpX
MAQTRFQPDRGLSARMVLTMLLLAGLFVLLMWAIATYTTGGWWLGIIIGLGIFWAQWYFSDTMAMRGMKAREVTPQEEPELHAMVDRLCAQANMPKPRVAVSELSMPNAFATGRSPKRAVVCATRGIMQRLDERELEGVMAHELSHVAHRDVTVMTIASVVGVLAGFLTRMTLWGGVGRNRDSGPVVLIIIVVSIVVYAVSFLLTRLLSRYRELAADRAGAFLTGQPSHLANALTKITGQMQQIPSRDLRDAEPYNAFFFAPAVTNKVDLASLFASHPPLEKRLDQLAKISRELGRH